MFYNTTPRPLFKAFLHLLHKTYKKAREADFGRPPDEFE
jgi:hypothetical protein